MSLAEDAANLVVPGSGLVLRLLGGIKAAGMWLISHPVVLASAVTAAAGAWGVHERHEAQDWQAAYIMQGKTFITAQNAAAAKAAAQKTKNEVALAAFAGVTDHDYEDGLADGRDRLAAYVAAHRVQSVGAGAPGGSSTAAEDHLASVSGQSAAAPTVAFTQQQLSGWDAAYDYAVSCRAFAQGIAARFDGMHQPSDVSSGTDAGH